MHDDEYYFELLRHNIRKYRIKSCLTQQQLADKADITMNYLAKIEATSIKTKKGFSIATLGRIADALEIDIRKLFDPIDEDS